MSEFRNVHVYFALLIPATLLGFVPFLLRGVTLSDRPLTPAVLLHGALMGLWVIMLVAQGWFIRTKRFAVHRWVGRSSFMIAPLIIVNVFVAEHEALNAAPQGISAEVARLEVFGIPQILVFAVTWGFAIAYRKRIPLHARFMISTAFAVSTAILVRIALNWLTWLPFFEPENLGGIVAATWTFQTLLLAAFIAMDWRKGIRRSPFWVVTGVLGMMHVGYWTYGTTAAWFAFVRWFAGLRFGVT
ncbi:MAG: hypothetical protein D6696_17640 [Acidobacteria bacterium]|nr:MAG: hypothetical protein D6696_17640 [Acidobacteriota bacterium]